MQVHQACGFDWGWGWKGAGEMLGLLIATALIPQQHSRKPAPAWAKTTDTPTSFLQVAIRRHVPTSHLGLLCHFQSIFSLMLGWSSEGYICTWGLHTGGWWRPEKICACHRQKWVNQWMRLLPLYCRPHSSHTKNQWVLHTHFSIHHPGTKGYYNSLMTYCSWAKATHRGCGAG